MKSEISIPLRLYDRLLGRYDQYHLYQYLLVVYERHPEDFKTSFEGMMRSLNQHHFDMDSEESDRLFNLFKDGAISSHITKFREVMNAIVDRSLILEDEILNVVYDRTENETIYLRVKAIG